MPSAPPPSVKRTGSSSAKPALASARSSNTIIESCRRRKLDPYTYLRGILARLPHLTNHQISEVTPAAWAKAQHKSSKR